MMNVLTYVINFVFTEVWNTFAKNNRSLMNNLLLCGAATVAERVIPCVRTGSGGPSDEVSLAARIELASLTEKRKPYKCEWL